MYVCMHVFLSMNYVMIVYVGIMYVCMILTNSWRSLLVVGDRFVGVILVRLQRVVAGGFQRVAIRI